MRPLATTGARGWILLIFLALAPMWLIGTLDRGAWTPDEPREADIAWRMSVQSHWVLPHLANQPFLEKPPLSYWMSAGSIRWHDLPSLATQIQPDAEQASLALLNPDETTIAMLDRRLRISFTVLRTDASSPQKAVRSWFMAQGNRARVLVLLPGHASGELTPLLARVHPSPPAGDGVAGELQTEGIAAIVRRYQLPHGRRYALLGPPRRAE